MEEEPPKSEGPIPLNYASPGPRGPSGRGAIVGRFIGGFIASFLMVNVCMVMCGFAAFGESEHGGGGRGFSDAVSIVNFGIALLAIVLIVTGARRPGSWRTHPFLLGVLVAALVSGLMEGVCFTRM